MERFVISIIVCSFMMTAVSFLYLLLSKTLKNIQGSKWRYYSWILILIGFITPVKPNFGFSRTTLRSVIIDTGEASITAYHFDIGDYSFVDLSEIPLLIIFFIWLTGVIVTLSVTYYKHRLFIRSIKRLAVPVSRDIAEKANMLAVDICVAADFKIVTVKEVASPMVAGLFKPFLILPDRTFTDKELYLILKHELIHLKHHDLFIKAFMLICTAVHWFNPFIRMFIRTAEQECELYCDETVMRNESAELKKVYCQSILNTVSAERKIKGRLVPVLSSNFYFNLHGLKHRMKMILSFDKKRGLSFVCGLVAVLILSAGTVFAFYPNSYPEKDDKAYETTTFTTFYYGTSDSENLMTGNAANHGGDVSSAVSTGVTVITVTGDGDID